MAKSQRPIHGKGQFPGPTPLDIVLVEINGKETPYCIRCDMLLIKKSITLRIPGVRKKDKEKKEYSLPEARRRRKEKKRRKGDCIHFWKCFGCGRIYSGVTPRSGLIASRSYVTLPERRHAQT